MVTISSLRGMQGLLETSLYSGGYGVYGRISLEECPTIIENAGVKLYMNASYGALTESISFSSVIEKIRDFIRKVIETIKNFLNKIKTSISNLFNGGSGSSSSSSGGSGSSSSSSGGSGSSSSSSGGSSRQNTSSGGSNSYSSSARRDSNNYARLAAGKSASEVELYVLSKSSSIFADKESLLDVLGLSMRDLEVAFKMSEAGVAKDLGELASKNTLSQDDLDTLNTTEQELKLMLGRMENLRESITDDYDFSHVGLKRDNDGEWRDPNIVKTAVRLSEDKIVGEASKQLEAIKAYGNSIQAKCQKVLSSYQEEYDELDQVCRVMENGIVGREDSTVPEVRRCYSYLIKNIQHLCYIESRVIAAVQRIMTIVVKDMHTAVKHNRDIKRRYK